MSNLKIKPVETNQPFFGKYRYSVRFNIPELGVIRGLHLDKIDQIVRERNEWREQHKRLYSFVNGSNVITDSIKDNLKDLCELLIQYQDQIKFVVSYDRGYVYTNNLDLAKKLLAKQTLSLVQVREAKQISPQGTIALINPKWSHRTYFKSRTIKENQRKALIDYLQSRENVRLGPGLAAWVNERPGNLWWSNWTHAHFFIDHNNDGEVLFLNMVAPNITGKTLQIVAK